MSWVHFLMVVEPILFIYHGLLNHISGQMFAVNYLSPERCNQITTLYVLTALSQGLTPNANGPSSMTVERLTSLADIPSR